MSEEDEATHFREHWGELRRAMRGIGRDVKTDVADAPHLARTATKNALATAAGLRRKPMNEWSAETGSDADRPRS